MFFFAIFGGFFYFFSVWPPLRFYNGMPLVYSLFLYSSFHILFFISHIHILFSHPIFTSKFFNILLSHTFYFFLTHPIFYIFKHSVRFSIIRFPYSVDRTILPAHTCLSHLVCFEATNNEDKRSECVRKCVWSENSRKKNRKTDSNN